MAIRRVRPQMSQRFPYIALSKAIDRARELYRIANLHEVPVSAAAKSWNFSEKSSGVQQTVSALKSFGLLDDTGTNEARRIKLTDLAARIIRDPREISSERDLSIRQAALNPPIHREVYEKYRGLPPSDEAFKAHLLMDRGFKDEAVNEFIREFMATMSFAKISESGTDQTPSDPSTGSVGLDDLGVLPASSELLGASTFSRVSPPLESSEINDIKVLLDGNTLRVSAWVDLRGLRRLRKILNAHEALFDGADED